jgi:hypothetical protein
MLQVGSGIVLLGKRVESVICLVQGQNVGLGLGFLMHSTMGLLLRGTWQTTCGTRLIGT